MMKLALGPILYFWERREVFEFYRAAAGWPVDVIYLGEMVCGKRRELRRSDWLAIARDLAGGGKEVVLSTLALIEAESELSSVRRLIENGYFAVEANDMGTVNMAAGRVPFVAGPYINTYNAATLALLAEAGAFRWVMPVELDCASLAALQAARPSGMQTEVYGFGQLPLSLSARCFTARAHNLGKDDCAFRCRDYPEGMLLSTQDDQPFLVLNGVQTLSARTYNLTGAIGEMKRLGVDVVRLSPRYRGTAEIVDVFRAALAADPPAPDEALRRLAAHTPHGSCNGHWHARPGKSWTV